MKRFLTLKHWQLFIVSWGALLAVFLCLVVQPIYLLHYLPIWFTIFLVGAINSFAWVWIVVKDLSQRLDSEIRPNSQVFKIAFWIPASFISIFILQLLYHVFVEKIKSFNPSLEMKILDGLILLSIGCIIYGLCFTARIIRTAELRRDVRIHEFIFEAILMVLAPIGMWIIQPRVNRVVSK